MGAAERAGRGRRADRRGAGTALVALVAGLVLLAFGVVALTGRVVLVRDRTGVAADQAALAAAAAIAGGGGTGDLAHLGCPVAGEVVRRNRVRLVSCVVVGDAQEFAVTVTAEADLGFRTPGLPTVVRRDATAGRASG